MQVADEECSFDNEASTPPSTPPSDPERADVGESTAAKAGTVVLLDWDDTLLPSTMLTSLGYKVDESTALPPDLASDLAGLEEDVIMLLDTCQQHGTVLLVTNAETGWVELSSERFMPTVIGELHKRGIKVVSARSAYESRFPNSPVDWKQEAFVSEVDILCSATDAINLVSIGDSVNERNAAHHVGVRYGNGNIKTVKFVERPDIDQIRRQLSLVASNLQDISMHEGSFDVNLVC
jgi:hypothetical protein